MSDQFFVEANQYGTNRTQAMGLIRLMIERVNLHSRADGEGIDAELWQSHQHVPVLAPNAKRPGDDSRGAFCICLVGGDRKPPTFVCCV
jgi:hypothetical protein